MMKINTSVLVRLADPKLENAYKKAGMTSLPANIMQALEAKLEKKREEAAGAAAEEIIKLYEASDNEIESFVNDIRELRTRIKQYKKQLEKIGKAKAYGAATGNYLPLAKAMNIYVAAENVELTKIPEGWEPEVQPE